VVTRADQRNQLPEDCATECNESLLLSVAVAPASVTSADAHPLLGAQDQPGVNRSSPKWLAVGLLLCIPAWLVVGWLAFMFWHAVM
jgi:hypothetical protein